MAKLPIIGTIRKKIEGLIADNTSLRAEGRKLIQQRDRLSADNKELTMKIAKLEKRISILELTGGIAVSSEKDIKKAKARVNNLIREVDRCMALLNK